MEGIGEVNMDKVCQFYIILGNKEYQGKNDGNVYINATGVRDINLIKDAIFKYYHKKSKENIKVSNRIIFLIPDSSLDAQCQMIIDQLHLVGEIQYLSRPQEKIVSLDNDGSHLSEKSSSKEALKPIDDLRQESNPQAQDIPIEKETKNTLEEVRQEIQENSSKEEKSTDLSSLPKDNIYRGDIENSLLNKKENHQNRLNEEMREKDSATYMGYNPTLINNNVRSIVGNHKKSAFVSLPVIVFILSAILLIASIVILFVLD